MALLDDPPESEEALGAALKRLLRAAHENGVTINRSWRFSVPSYGYTVEVDVTPLVPDGGRVDDGTR